VRPIRSSTIYVFKDEDIAFLEIEPSYVPYLKTKQVASYSLFNNHVTLHLTSVSTVILHAVPYERMDLSFEEKEITLNTFPYVTFAKGIKNDFIDIDINRKGKNELGEEAIVPDIYGMSGSGVWTLHPGEDTAYRLAGIVTNGRTDSGSVYALDINFVVGLLTTHLRENEAEL